MTTTLRKLTYDDFWTFKDFGHVALSPDGRRVAFVLLSKNKEKNETRSTIMLLSLDEQGRAIGEPRQLTSGVKQDANPAWAPDSRRLLFVSNREEKRQLWLIDTDGGEARKLTNLLNGVQAATWSPDGQWIAFTASAAPSDDDDFLIGRKSLDEEARKKREEEERFGPHTITKIFYRLDGHGFFEKFSQLFVMPAPVDDTPIDATAIRRLTADDLEYSLPSWSPDSTEIAVLRTSPEDLDRLFVNELWTFQRETGQARRIVDNSFEIISYAWSPDGQRIVVVGAQDMRKEGDSVSRLLLVSREGGELQVLTQEIDNPVFPHASAQFGFPLSTNYPAWSPDGERIYFLVMEHGRANVHRLDLEQKSITQLTTGEHFTFFLALLPAEQALLLVQSELVHPWEFHLLPLDAAHTSSEQAPERLTHLYDRALSEFALSKPERIQYKGSNGDLIDGWIMLPVGAKTGVRYPLLVNIHGGPQSAYSVGMSLNFQYFAAQGYAVFYCNPHGSTGYGQQFARSVEGDWGGQDFQDIMLGVDACIARGVADPERLVVTGYSYGGYMSMFIIGHTNRFKAAAPMAGISNLASFVGTSDIGFWGAIHSKGYPWDPERAEYYRERSPLMSAHCVSTPTLFLHPEHDLRCPIEQTEQFYMALKMMGKVPVEFVRVPEAWHVSAKKPGSIFARWQKMFEWFNKYIEIRPDEYA
ncbi:MAG TPA: S9 family peptidase [Ktedonobacteraceae bacterium]